MTRRQFGSIGAYFHRGAPRGQVLAGNMELHAVWNAHACDQLIDFWRRQQAPSSGAIVEALGWLRGKFAEVES